MSLISLNNYFKENDLSSETYIKLCSMYFEARKTTGQSCAATEVVIEKTIERFESRDDEQKRYILNHLTFYIELYTSISKNKVSANDNKKHLWMALGALKLTPPNDLLDAIDGSDCIEIYDTSGIQCYRDYTFSSLISYSLPETLYSPWFNLYARSSTVLEAMHSEATQAFTSAKTHFNSKIPDHFTDEVSSDRQKRFKVSFKKISPLFNKEQKASAFLATSSLEFVEEMKDKGALHEVQF